MEVQQDFKELFELFNTHDVEYLIVGGYALAFHGAPRYTGDIDIFIKPDIENARKIIKVLDIFGFGTTGLTTNDFTTKNQVIQLLSYVFILIVKAVLNYYLILKYDANGAAAATVISMFVLMIVQVPFVVPKLIKFRVMTVVSPFMKLIIATAVIAAGLYYFSSIHIVFKIVIPAIVYLLMLLTLKVFSENDKMYFQKLLKKKA